MLIENTVDNSFFIKLFSFTCSFLDSNNKVKKLNPESDHYSQEEKFHQYESHQPDWAKKVLDDRNC